MTRKESRKMAKQIRDIITNFNDVNDEAGFDLYTFKIDENEFNVFAYIRKEQDEQYPEHKWYSVYAGVEYEGGDNVYADYNNSTDHLRVSELANTLFRLSNMYKQKKNLDKLKNMLERNK